MSARRSPPRAPPAAPAPPPLGQRVGPRAYPEALQGFQAGITWNLPVRVVDENPRRASLVLRTEGSGNVRIGGADVSRTRGLLMASGATLVLDNYRGPLYVVSQSTTVNGIVSWMEVMAPE